MDRLPNEVLIMIFELLPSRDLLEGVGRVCRRWEELVERRALGISQQDDLLKLHQGIITIEMTARLDSLRFFMNAACETCPHLRNLTVHAANAFTRDNLEALQRLPCLEHLDIFIQSRYVDEQVTPVLMRLSSLVINETVCPDVLRILAKNQRLRALYMYGRALYYPPRELLHLIQVRRHHLRELTLRCNELQDHAYVAIAQCEFLTSLQLYSCWLMTLKGAMYIIQPKLLKRLHVTGARMVRSKALVIIVEHLPLLLEELVLSATCFTDMHVPCLITRLPYLRILELWRCSLTVQSILMLVSGLRELKTLDIDIRLLDPNIRTILKHRSLTSLRCALKGRDSHLRVKDNGDYLKVLSVFARYEKKYIRTGGEGHRGALYYFWTRDRDLEPSTIHPIFDDDDEEF